MVEVNLPRDGRDIGTHRSWNSFVSAQGGYTVNKIFFKHAVGGFPHTLLSLIFLADKVSVIKFVECLQRLSIFQQLNEFI